MKKLIGIFLLFWASGVFAQSPVNDDCAKANSVNICSINSSTGFAQSTISEGEFLPFNGLISNNLITKSIYFKFTLSAPRRLDVRVKGLPVSTIDNHAGFAIYKATDCNSLNNSTLIGSYPDLNSAAQNLNLLAGTYYVQVVANHLFTNEVSVEIAPKTIDSHDNSISPYFLTHDSPTAWINIDNLSLDCGEVAPAGYEKSFWAKFEIPAGQYAVPFRLWIEGYLGNVKMVLRKNSPTAAPIADQKGNTLSNYLYPASAVSYCGLDAGTYYAQVFFPTSSSGNFVFFNRAFLQNTPIPTGTSLSNPIPVVLNQTQNVVMVCNPTASLSCNSNYKQNSFVSITIPSNGELKLAVNFLQGLGELRLFRANGTTVGTCKPITDGTVLSYCGLTTGKYYARLSFQTVVSNYAITPTHQPNNVGTTFSNALVLANDVPKTVDITCRSLSSPSVCSPTYQKHSFVSVYVSGSGELRWTIDGLAGTGAFQLFNAKKIAVGTCRNIANGTVLSYCGLAAGKYYARLSFPKTTNQYTIKANEYANSVGDKIALPVVLRENNQLKEVSIRTQCLTLDTGENNFSSLYSKSLIAKIQIPTAQYGNPLNISLSPQGGNFETKGKVLFRMFEGSLNGSLVTNKAGQSFISAENGAINTEYCELKAGEYWVQVLFETQADYTLNLKASGEISEKHNRFNAQKPYTPSAPMRDDGRDTIQVADYLACAPPSSGVTCALPYCSTFLQWTQNTAKIVTVSISPSDLRYKIWKVQNGQNCHYIDFVTTCGNGSAALGAGTYMMQVYSPTPIGSTPILAMITVILTSPNAQNNPLNHVIVNQGAENQEIANINFDDRMDFINIPSHNSVWQNNDNPCRREVSLVGFDLQRESFVKFAYDPNFKMRLFKAHTIDDLAPDNEIMQNGDSSYFCSLQAQKYIMVLYSGFQNISKKIKISALPVLSSKAPSLAQAQNNNLGLNPVNSTLNDQIGCSTQRSETDNLPTTNAERHIWFTWTSDKAGSFTLQGDYTVYDPQKFRFFLYHSDGNAFVTTASQLIGLGEYNINAHSFATPCHTRRYYLQVLAKPNYSVNIKVNFVANPHVNVGNYMNNAHQISFGAAGTYSVQSEDIACHDLSPTDYNENNPNDPFTAGLSNYKSTWFKIRNQTVAQNMDVNLNISHNLGNLQFIRYRILKANSIGTGVIGEGASLTSLNGTNNLGCFTNPYYYVQVITNQAAQGRITLNVTASNNNGICPKVSPCDIIATTQWTGNLDQDWAKPNNWTNGIPTINTNVIIPTTSRSPIIKTSVWAANITLQGSLHLEPNGKLTLNGNWTNQSSQTEFGGTVEFSGCTKQFIKGNLSRFVNLEVNNVQSLELESSVEIKKLLHLREGNLISNGKEKLNLLSNPSTSAMIVQKQDGSNGVIGAANVQRYIFGTNACVTGSYAHPYGYHYLSSPVQNAKPFEVFGASLVCNSAYNSNPEPAYTNPFPTFFGYNESRAGFTRGTPPYRYSAFTAGWEVPNCQEVMTPAKGYNANIAHQSTLNFAGNLNNGSITIPASRGTTGDDRGWNVVGNPYPAPILWSTLFNFENNAQFFDNAIYKRIALGKETGTWASYVNGISTNCATDTIAIGEGFLVRLKENQTFANLKMDNSVRVSNYDRAALRSARIEQRKKGLIKLALKNGKQSDQTVVYFERSATENFDAALDALKLMNADDAFQVGNEPSHLNLYTQAQDKYLAINALPVFELEKSPVVPLSFEISESGKYEFESIELWYFSKNTKVYLEDRQTNTFVNLNETKNYTFSAEAGIHSKRFFLHFSENKLVSPENDISVYPNPVAQNTKVRLVNNYQGQVRIKLFNAQGREIWHSTEQKSVGAWEYDLLLSELPQGLYILDIQTLDQKFSKKIIKQ